MIHKFTFVINYTDSIVKKNKRDSRNIRKYLSFKNKYAGCNLFSAEKINKYIKKKINEDIPFMVGRFGATELFAIRTFDFRIESKYDKALEQLQTWSGFFPKNNESGYKFCETMLPLIENADVMGIWMLPFEEYYLKLYGSDSLQLSYLLDIEPWGSPSNPWSAALKGRKVLVIHPFEETIKSQYDKRELLFPGTDILPEFELKTLKAVQTIAGEKDERFVTWFEALEWMYQEAMKIDFDVAIIGCGAYGFPLAAKLKQAGKKAIHLAGATQLLFGIKGRRWEEDNAFNYVQKFFNEAWVYPSEADKPKQAQKVEDGCYW